jgi:hypothetical protein
VIKYRLICKDCEIIFDSWFASSNEYEKLKKNNFLNCHNCSSRKIEKTLMAPKLIGTKDNSKNNFESKKYDIIKKTINKYQKFIKKNFEYVGENFAYEARSIHYENKKKTKGIYGNASQKDLKELSEEGIDIQTIPWVENKDN